MSLNALRAAAVGDWEVCGECFYAREHLYDMQWEDVDLESKKVCAAAFGGPIALMRDDSQMVVVTGTAIQPIVRITSASGAPVGSFLWDEEPPPLTSAPLPSAASTQTGIFSSTLNHARGPLVAWGWSADEQLVVVRAGGMVAVRSLSGALIREFSMGVAAAADGIAAAVVGPSGAVVVLTRAMHVWVVDNLADPRPVRLAEPPITSDLLPRVRVAVLEHHTTLSGTTEVLLTAGGSVWQLDETSATEHALPPPPSRATALPVAPTAQTITAMAVSPGGAFLALLTASGRLTVWAADFSRQLSEFETHADAPPVAMAWCGADAVVLQWPELLLIVGPHGDHAAWTTDSKTVLIPEVDGVRLLTSSKHELLRKVPTALAEVLRPGSTSPGTQLLDARELLDQGAPRADKALRLLADRLPAAVVQCVDAAGADLSPARQKALLRAAAYGRAFIQPADMPAHAAYDIAFKLRLLNALRDPGVSIPLTMVQLGTLGLPAVVAKLVVHRQWLLASRIAASLTHASPTLLAPAPSSTASPSAPAPPLPPLLLSDASGFHAPGLSLLPAAFTPSTAASSLQAAASAHALASGAAAAAVGAGAGVSPAAVSAALQELVLSQWACAKISAASAGGPAAGLGDAELKEVLMAKLKGCAGMRFAPLAAHAQSVGRRRLALMLLEEESSCALQVPLLLSLAVGQPGGKGRRVPGMPGVYDDGEGEGEVFGGAEGAAEDAAARALRKAIESGDTDLVYLVLFRIYRTRPLQAFWQLVSGRTLARNLFTKYCRAKEPELLAALLEGAGQSTELADLQVSQALGRWADAHTAHNANDTELVKLTSALSTASQQYATSRDHVFQSKAASDAAVLLREQARLERETGQALLVGLSVTDTLRALIRLGHHRQAGALRKQFGVSDKAWWWVRARTLAESRDWEGLEALAAEKKSPIGYTPFLEVGRANGAPRDIQARLIGRMPDSAQKAEEYAAIEYAREAAEVAARLRDGDLLRRVTDAVSANSPAGMAIAQIRERFFGASGGGGSGGATPAVGGRGR